MTPISRSKVVPRLLCWFRGHIFGDWEPTGPCQKVSTCARCGEEGRRSEHVWADWNDSYKDGYYSHSTRSCQCCGDEETTNRPDLRGLHRCDYCGSPDLVRIDWEGWSGRGGGHDGMHPIRMSGQYHRCVNCGVTLGDDRDGSLSDYSQQETRL
jgi:hypothetical protein